MRAAFFSAQPSSAQLTEIAKLVDAGKLKPVVETVLPLSEARRAQELNPLHPGWYHFSFARLDYNRKAYEGTIRSVEKIGLPHFYWTHLLDAAAKGQLNRPDAGRALSKILEIKPNFSAQLELRKWNASPKDLDHIVEGLRRAGLNG